MTPTVAIDHSVSSTYDAFGFVLRRRRVNHLRISSIHRTRLATAPMRIASAHGIGVVWKISFMNGTKITAACRSLD